MFPLEQLIPNLSLKEFAQKSLAETGKVPKWILT
jgi:hypothetical protein